MSAAIRDPLADHLITLQNSALILIDYQPSQVEVARDSQGHVEMSNAEASQAEAAPVGA